MPTRKSILIAAFILMAAGAVLLKTWRLPNAGIAGSRAGVAPASAQTEETSSPASASKDLRGSSGAGPGSLSPEDSLYCAGAMDHLTPLLCPSVDLTRLFTDAKEGGRLLEAPGGAAPPAGAAVLRVLWRPGQVMDCPCCFELFGQLEALRRRLPEDALGIQVLVPDGLGTRAREALDADRIPWEVWEIPWDSLRDLRGAEATPFLIVSDSKDRLLAAWYPGPTEPGHRFVLVCLSALVARAGCAR